MNKSSENSSARRIINSGEKPAYGYDPARGNNYNYIGSTVAERRRAFSTGTEGTAPACHHPHRVIGGPDRGNILIKVEPDPRRNVVKFSKN